MHFLEPSNFVTLRGGPNQFPLDVRCTESASAVVEHMRSLNAFYLGTVMSHGLEQLWLPVLECHRVILVLRVC